MKTEITVIGLALLLGGCVYPSESVQTLDDRPMLSIKGAPDGAVLLVDGVEMGNAAQYDGDKRVLRIEPGTHSIQVRKGDTLYHQGQVYVGSGTAKTISVSGGAQS
mgnify:CR=1 FL=1